MWILGDTTEAAAGATLNASGGSASYTSVAMLPSGARTVTGAITAGSPLINLNGAKNVSINGENVGGNSLTLSNTTASATAGTSTIRLINGAQTEIAEIIALSLSQNDQNQDGWYGLYSINVALSNVISFFGAVTVNAH